MPKPEEILFLEIHKIMLLRKKQSFNKCENQTTIYDEKFYSYEQKKK